MKSNRLKLPLFLVSIISSSTYANSESWQENFSIGATLGKSNHHSELTYDDQSSSSSSYELNINYQLTKHISVGLGYVDFGESDESTSQAIYDGSGLLGGYTEATDGSGFTISSTFSYQLSDTPWDLKAKIGLIDWDSGIIRKNFSSNSESIDYSESKTNETGIDFFAGLGIYYQLSTKLSFGLSYELYPLSFNSQTTTTFPDGTVVTSGFDGDNDFTLYGLNLAYSF